MLPSGVSWGREQKKAKPKEALLDHVAASVKLLPWFSGAPARIQVTYVFETGPNESQSEEEIDILETNWLLN